MRVVWSKIAGYRRSAQARQRNTSPKSGQCCAVGPPSTQRTGSVYLRIGRQRRASQQNPQSQNQRRGSEKQAFAAVADSCREPVPRAVHGRQSATNLPFDRRQRAVVQPEPEQITDKPVADLARPELSVW